MKAEMYGEMLEGREERKDEKKKGSIPEVIGKGPKHQTSTPKSIKKGCRDRAKNRPKRLPKRR